MIKYVELTAPEVSTFRQAKIVSIECAEGDRITKGDTLFMVKSGSQELPLPATENGTIAELIVAVDTNITLSTPLLLLETEVPESTASKGLDEMVDARDQPLSEKLAADQREQRNDSRLAADSGPQEVVLTLEAQPIEIPDAELKTLAKKKKTATAKNDKAKTKAERQQNLDLLIDYHIETSKVQASSDDAKAVKVIKPTEQRPAGISDHTQATHSTQAPRENPVTTTNKEQPQPETTPMSSDSKIEIRVPDIGADSAKVIEILVQEGDTLAAEDAIVTLESDKASMDVPAPEAGVVVSIDVAIDDDVSEGSLLLTLAAAGAKSPASDAEPSVDASPVQPEASKPEPSPATTAPSTQNDSAVSTVIPIKVPDIGGDSAKVIEILVAEGDDISEDDSIITLESDKASMDVPSSASGVVDSIAVSIDDDLSEGDVILHLKTAAPASDTTAATAPASAANSQSSIAQPPQQASAPSNNARQNNSTVTAASSTATNLATKSHASPSVRRFARELGAELSKVKGTGRKGRVLKDDVKAFVKNALSAAKSAPAAAQGAGIPQVPAQDFSKFGEIEVQALNKIKRLTANNVHRSWLNVPHVTHNDEANISDLESFRKQINADFKANQENVKVSPLAFIVKAVVRALRKYPQFNSSLEPGGENLILKKYFHIGIAVDTPNGLVVPVIRDADKKSVSEIATEMSELAAKARDKKLTMNDMSGACFTISSLGGIGGTGFTPIVNAPEVAILGVSRSKIQPVWNGEEFAPGLMLPLSLSYDHRVIDGAEAARFARHVADVLEDVRLLTI